MFRREKIDRTSFLNGTAVTYLLEYLSYRETNLEVQSNAEIENKPIDIQEHVYDSLNPINKDLLIDHLEHFNLLYTH